jgi:predicted nucleic acid-binding protein
MIYIFDSSFVGSLVIPDENNLYVKKLYGNIQNEDEKYAPHMFWYEIANIFQNLIRRNRFTYDRVLQFFPFLTTIQLTIDFESGPEYAQKLLRLCKTYNLSSYDAAYLELAERKNAVLCTLDEGLRAAAKKHGVPVIK